MDIHGNVAYLRPEERQVMGVDTPSVFIAKLRCAEVLQAAKHACDAIESGDNPADYLPADIFAAGFWGRGVFRAYAKHRLEVATTVSAQVLVHETEQHLLAQAGGNAVDQ